MQKNKTFYPNAGYWFLLLIPLIVAGFYPSYFAQFFKPAASIIHIHFTLMAIWVAMLIIQPFLFKYKKLSLHRKIGRFSYLLVPLLLLSAFLMIRLSYYRFLAAPPDASITNRQALLKTAAAFMSIAFVYLGLFGLFYLLAVINRHKAAVHARYMVATALTLLGPTVDRITYAVFKETKLGGFIPIEIVAFILADGILLFLLWGDIKAKRPVKPLLTCLLILLVVQSCYFLFQQSNAWADAVTWMMQAS